MLCSVGIAVSCNTEKVSVGIVLVVKLISALFNFIKKLSVFVVIAVLYSVDCFACSRARGGWCVTFANAPPKSMQFNVLTFYSFHRKRSHFLNEEGLRHLL